MIGECSDDSFIEVDGGKTARRDLCGGCRVTGSPTAINFFLTPTKEMLSFLQTTSVGSVLTWLLTPRARALVGKCVRTRYGKIKLSQRRFANRLTCDYATTSQRKRPLELISSGLQFLAPQVGLEPTTLRLTAECSAIELLRNKRPHIVN